MTIDHEINEEGLLIYCPVLKTDEGDRKMTARLVIPEALQIQCYITITLAWRSVTKWSAVFTIGFAGSAIEEACLEVCSVMWDYVWIARREKWAYPSRDIPGNVKATYSFQVNAMDHIPSLPKSHTGNTELLIWVDLFTKTAMAKASASLAAQIVAEGYEKCVFRCFGDSEVIRHDREPVLMSDFFRAFNRMAGQRQRATMAY
uniref:Integrase catalytic domain-containing protein n=1 Tax=Peronospora matthiolae TaxID=2874970 RepID=A0AAV1URJ1_9STRA